MSMNDPKDNPLMTTLDRVPIQAVQLEIDGPTVRVLLLIDSTWRDVIVLDVFSGYTDQMQQTQFVPAILASPVAANPPAAGSYPGGILARPLLTPGDGGVPELIKEHSDGKIEFKPSPAFLARVLELTTPPEERLTARPGLEGVTASMLKDTDTAARAAEQRLVDAMVDEEIERHRATAARASEIYVSSELPRAEVLALDDVEDRRRQADHDAAETDRRTVERLKKEQREVGPRTKGPKTKGGRKK